MADDQVYVYNPDADEANQLGMVPSSELEAIKSQGYAPISEQQAKEIKARREVRQSPIAEGVKAAAESVADVASWALPIPVAAARIAFPLAMSQVPSAAEIAAKVAPESDLAQTAPYAKAERMKLAQQMAQYLSVPGLEAKAGISTPEKIQARTEEFPKLKLGTEVAAFVLPGVAAAMAEKAAGEAAAKKLAAAEAERQALAVRDMDAAAAASKAQEAASRAEILAQERIAKAKIFSKPSEAFENLAAPLKPITETAEAAAREVIEHTPVLRAISGRAKDIVARAAGRSVGSAVIGATFAAGHNVSEMALGNPDLVAEKAMSEVASGAIWGAGLEAGLGVGLPAVGGLTTGALKAAKEATARVRDWALDHYAESSAKLLGAEIRDVESLVRLRGEIKERDFADRLNEQIGLRLDADRIARGESIPTPPVRPVSAVVSSAREVELKKQQSAKELASALQQQHDAFKQLTIFANTVARPAETNRLIYKKIKSEINGQMELFQNSTRGRPLTAEESVTKEMIQNGSFVYRPYAEAFDDLVGKARQLRSTLGLPEKWPETVRARLDTFFDRLDDFSASNPTPTEMHRAAKRLKAELFEKGMGRAQRQDLSQLDARVGGKIDELRKDFVEFTTNESLFGEAAKRERLSNEIYTDFLALDKDRKSKGSFFRKINGNWSVNEEGIHSLINQTKPDPITGEIPLDVASKWKWLANWTGAGSRIIQDTEAAAKRAGVAFNSDLVAGSLAESIVAGEKALRFTLDRAQRKMSITANKAAQQEYQQAQREYVAYMADREQQVKSAADLLKRPRNDFETTYVIDRALSTIPVVGHTYEAWKAMQLIRTNPEVAMKNLARIERAAQKADEKIHGFVDTITSVPIRSRAVPVSGALPVIAGYQYGSMQNERDRYDENVKNIKTVMLDGKSIDNHIDKSIGSIPDYAPNIANSLAQKTALVTSYLNDRIPKPPAGLSPYQAAAWRPTDAQVREFNKVYNAVDMPLSVLSDAINGSLTDSQVAAIKDNYPQLINQIRAELVERMKQNPQGISREQRAMISKLLGIDVDGSANPQSIIGVQNVYGSLKQPQPKNQQQVPVSRAQGLNMSGRAGQETTAWREAQKDYGR